MDNRYIELRIADRAGAANSAVHVGHEVTLEFVDGEWEVTEEHSPWKGRADSTSGAILDFLACRLGLHPEGCYESVSPVVGDLSKWLPKAGA